MPRGLGKFHFSFERTGLTRFGGLSLFQPFCKSLGLRCFFQLYVRWPNSLRGGAYLTSFAIFCTASSLGET